MKRPDNPLDRGPLEMNAWRERLTVAECAVDEAQVLLSHLCQRINVADDADDLTRIAEGVQSLLQMCQSIAVEIDEITTYERVHALISMMHGVLIFIDLRVQGTT